MNTKRIAWADIAKGIGILAIIAGHMGVLSLIHLVFTFHVPLFFLISGYFLSTKDSLKDFALKKAKVLLIPYAFTCVLQIIAKIIVDLANHTPDQILSDVVERFIEALYGSGSSAVRTPFGIDQIGAIWFLLALFWSLLIVKYFIQKENGLLYICIIAGFSFVSAVFFWFPFSIQPGGIGALFVYIGYYARKRNVNFEKINYPLMLLGFVVFALEFHFEFFLSMASNKYDGLVLSMLGAIIISYAVICISVLIERIPLLSKPLTFFGKNSLVVLCFHIVDVDNVPWNLAYAQFDTWGISPTLSLCIVYVAKVCLMALCTFVVLKVKPLRKVFNR